MTNLLGNFAIGQHKYLFEIFSIPPDQIYIIMCFAKDRREKKVKPIKKTIIISCAILIHKLLKTGSELDLQSVRMNEYIFNGNYLP